VIARAFARQRGFVDVCCDDAGRRDAKPPEQFEAARAGRSENQFRCGDFGRGAVLRYGVPVSLRPFVRSWGACSTRT
jgi:hypothetical protein